MNIWDQCLNFILHSPLRYFHFLTIKKSYESNAVQGGIIWCTVRIFYFLNIVQILFHWIKSDSPHQHKLLVYEPLWIYWGRKKFCPVCQWASLYLSGNTWLKIMNNINLKNRNISNKLHQPEEGKVRKVSYCIGIVNPLCGLMSVCQSVFRSACSRSH